MDNCTYVITYINKNLSWLVWNQSNYNVLLIYNKIARAITQRIYSKCNAKTQCQK